MKSSEETSGRPAARAYSRLDRLLVALDGQLRDATGVRPAARPDRRSRPYPGEKADEGRLSPEDRVRVARMMRVNHAGEVAAQALYEGQAVLARSETVRQVLNRAASEERDHLDWCERRLGELEATRSRLHRFWYLGSFLIGVLAAARGDRSSLGFVGETERQVVKHLERHLERLPRGDRRTRFLLAQMARDEARHGTAALAAGGRRPELCARVAMRVSAKVMTALAARI